MSFQRTDDWNKVQGILEQQLQRVEDAICFNFRVVGEGSVNHARKHGSYTDQTGNLRNSIGYVIAFDGKIIECEFKHGSGITNKAAFLADNKIHEMLAGDSGYTLLIIAGMNYARSVENRGKNVLTGTEKYLKSEVKAKMSNILSKAGFR
ncbi:MAG: hypothetical protein LUH01_17625 [Parabacteroides gordonii]|nr:hypothetical protein [Parabacteroides gordonii]